MAWAAARVVATRAVTAMRQKAAELAPSPDEEARILSRGIASGGKALVSLPWAGQLYTKTGRGPVSGRSLRGGLIGTPEGNRFIRGAAFGVMPMQQAILSDRIDVSREFMTRTSLIRRGGGPPQVRAGQAFEGIVARTGFADTINRRTGFYWLTRRKGIRGPTQPFNNSLVQAYEYGGMTWIVVPRPGTTGLEPEPLVYAQRMRKTVRPYRMYLRAAQAGRRPALADLRKTLRSEVRKAGRRQ